jgi:hypothetical protein
MSACSFTKELGGGATEPLIGGAQNSARPRCIHLIRLIRAGFEPFRARDIAGHLSNHRNR